MKPDGFEIGALRDIAARPPLVFVEGRGSWLSNQAGDELIAAQA